jgi:aminoglycoside 3-N-acetyltransferase
MNMYQKEDLVRALRALDVEPQDTLLVHSSMKAVGAVEGGADTVLDALAEAVADGLLILPTHSWKTMGEDRLLFDPLTEPSCVGILTNLFLKRPGVVRSLHATHSVAALGRGAAEYVAGEEQVRTPCGRAGCWGKLWDRNAKILFLGCPLSRNTYLHGVEEWNHIEDRLTETMTPFQVRAPHGGIIDAPLYRHHCSVSEDVSANYIKMEPVFLKHGAAKEGRVGDARSVLCDAAAMAELTGGLLKRDPNLFAGPAPVPENWY